MKLRNKLAFSYTVAFIALLGITFISIYCFSKKNRLNEFHQRFKDRSLISFRLIIEMRNVDDDILDKLDKSFVNNLRQNTFLLDSSSNLIYASTGNKKPYYADEIIGKLRHGSDEIFLPLDTCEVLATKFIEKGKTYYGLAKAEDKVGKETMRFLALLLLASFFISVVVIILLSYYLSGLITSPITKLAKEIENISPGKLSVRVSENKRKDEVNYLSVMFNELLDKVESAFKFQHQFIQHLSHELKTPLAVMMADAEAALVIDTPDNYKDCLQFQKDGLVELSNIMNTMLDISKKENHLIGSDSIRVDELLFDCVDEVSLQNSQAIFDLKIDQSIEKSERLTINGNSRMLKMAFCNLLKNAVNYSATQKVSIEIMPLNCHVQVSITNDGSTISMSETEYLFKQIFRGANAKTKGFGIGLILTNRIVVLHNGMIKYMVTKEGLNCFSTQFKLVG
jgi:signal transduction histidine kinase